MSRYKRALAVLAVVGIAAPAWAQYNPYPNQPPYDYPVYPGQPNPPQQTYPPYDQGLGTVGTIIDQLLGNHYNVYDRQAVTRCATAALAEAQSRYANYGYNGYNTYGGYGTAHVSSITGVERRSYDLRVSGLISFGADNRYENPYGYGNGMGDHFGYPSSAYGELSFRCNVDYRGNVTDVRVRPRDEYRRY